MSDIPALSGILARLSSLELQSYYEILDKRGETDLDFLIHCVQLKIRVQRAIHKDIHKIFNEPLLPDIDPRIEGTDEEKFQRCAEIVDFLNTYRVATPLFSSPEATLSSVIQDVVMINDRVSIWALLEYRRDQLQTMLRQAGWET